MFPTALAIIPALLYGQASQPVNLIHTFTKGEKNVYTVGSHLQIESRIAGVETWIPEDLDINYKFTTVTKELLPDGGVKLHYVRPGATETIGETFDSPPKTTTLKETHTADITLSRANEILTHSEDKTNKAGWIAPTSGRQQSLGAFLGQFIEELFRLSVFAGSMDNALDFSPKLPLQKVKIGDSWKRTIGYQPQKLKGAETMAIQRLDYVFTYEGDKESNGKKVIRITAKLSFDTDLAAFANQLAHADTGLAKLPIHLSAAIDFDLDPRTLKTLSASATSEGGFSIVLTENPTVPEEEAKLKGRTALQLVGSAIVETK